MSRHQFSSLETLESRIAPASLLTLIDSDGDTVRLVASKGHLELNTTVFTDSFGHLYLLDLTDPSFEHASISVTVEKGGPGDGFVNVGYLNATGRTLGSVTVDGDVGAIDAGVVKPGVKALQQLHVHSLGTLGKLTGAPDLESDIVGGVDRLRVDGDVHEADLLIAGHVRTGFIGGSILGGKGVLSGVVSIAGGVDSLVVRGDVVGGDSLQSGALYVSGASGSVAMGGSIKAGAIVAFNDPVQSVTVRHDLDAAFLQTVEASRVTIGGDIVGGDEVQSGVALLSKTKHIVVGGSIIGGTNDGSGALIGGGALSLQIGGSVIGGTSSGAGLVGFGDAGRVTIRGSVYGGTGDGSGVVAISGADGTHRASLLMGGDVVGGTAHQGQMVKASGLVSIDNASLLRLGGSLVAAQTEGNGQIFSSGLITAGGLGRLEIRGSLAGNAQQDALVTANTPVQGGEAIGTIEIYGRMDHARILAGFNPDLTASEPDAQLGSVIIHGDMIASDIVAGATSGNAGFGDLPQKINAPALDEPDVLSHIARVIVRGAVVMDPTEVGTVHGVVAEKIGAVAIAHHTVGLTPAAHQKFDLGPLAGCAVVEL